MRIAANHPGSLRINVKVTQSVLAQCSAGCTEPHAYPDNPIPTPGGMRSLVGVVAVVVDLAIANQCEQRSCESLDLERRMLAHSAFGSSLMKSGNFAVPVRCRRVASPS